MLRQTEEARERPLQFITAAARNAEQKGFLSLDDVMDDADAVIAEMTSRGP